MPNDESTSAFAAKYAVLCNLFEQFHIDPTVPPTPGELVPMTSPQARAYSNAVLTLLEVPFPGADMPDEVIRVLLTDSDNATLLVECPTSDEAEQLGYAAIMATGGVSAWRVPETAVPVTAELLDQLREGSPISGLDLGGAARS